MSREQELRIERKKIIKLLDRINQKDYSAISESLELLKGGKMRTDYFNDINEILDTLSPKTPANVKDMPNECEAEEIVEACKGIIKLMSMYQLEKRDRVKANIFEKALREIDNIVGVSYYTSNMTESEKAEFLRDHYDYDDIYRVYGEEIDIDISEAKAEGFEVGKHGTHWFDDYR
jgi:Asp-tRNA(Asn)/Glu-tRNA(Gln) amidotransferase C subunit